MESIYTSVVKILENGSGLDKVPSALRTLALYCGRFIDRRAYRRQFKALTKPDKEELKQFLDLKEDLDFSIYKNHLFCALLTMSSYPRKTTRRFKECAQAFHVCLSDVVQLLNVLSAKEQAQLVKKFQHPKIHSQEEVQEILSKLEPVIKGLSKHHLTYVAKHDLGYSLNDIRSELRMFAIYAIRRYEISYEHEHLIKTVVQALQHHVYNLAGKHGRPKHRRITRTHKVEGEVIVWHLDPQDWVIRRVSLQHGQKDRLVSADGKISIAAIFTKTKMQTYLPIDELYNSKEDANQERSSRQQGARRRTLPLIYLGKEELDEYQVTHTSLLQERGEEKTRLIDLIPSSLRADPTNQFLLQLSKSASHRLQEFAELICNQSPDSLFEKHLVNKHRDISILTHEQLGKLASRYLGVSLAELRNDLLSTCSSLWTLEQRARIMKELSDSSSPTIFTQVSKING